MLTNMLLHADHHFYSSSQFASYYQYSQSSQFFEQMLRESSEIRAPSSGESRIPVVGRLKMVSHSFVLKPQRVTKVWSALVFKSL